MKIRRVALVGGPCSGKSSILEMLLKVFFGQLLVVPEMAQALLAGVMPVPGRDLRYVSQWQAHFQRAIVGLQVQAEDAWTIAAEQKGIGLLLCDRGLLDGAAYWDGGPGAFCRDFDLDRQEVFARYEVVIHLQSLAVRSPEEFKDLRGKNSDRFETLEETRRLETATLAAWDGHPNRHVVNGTAKNILAKAVAVQGLVQGILGECN
jgi:hypothetical protein